MLLMNVKKALMTAPMAALLLFSTQSLMALQTAPSQSVQLKVEVSDTETVALGMTQQEIEKTLNADLTAAGISITQDTTAPILMLRFKSVQAAHVVASFIQLALLEEAELIRGKNHIQAMTWSQATLLTTPKEEFVKDTSKTIDMMIAAFIEDYKKAFPAPQTKPVTKPATSLPNQTPSNTISPSQPESLLIPEQAQ